MKNSTVNDDSVTRRVRRVARLWSGVVIGLGVLVFVTEIMEAATTELAPYPWYENLIPFTLFLGVAGLALGWRWEGPGGALAVGSMIVNFSVYLMTGRQAVGAVALILTPILVPGILFLVCWGRTHKSHQIGTA